MDFTESNNVLAYDPSRKRVVRVPAAQAELLRNAGYTVGDKEANEMAANDGWGGSVKAFGEGALSGATAGLSDLAMPTDMAATHAKLKQLHPIANGIGQVLGIGGAGLATGGLAPEVGFMTRLAHAATAGGTAEITRAQEHNEPIQAERILHGIGLGALFGAVAEGAGAITTKLPALAKKGLAGLDSIYPRASNTAQAYGEELPAFSAIPSGHRPSLPDSVPRVFGELPESEFVAAKELPNAAAMARSANAGGGIAIGAQTAKYRRALSEDMSGMQMLGMSVMPNAVKGPWAAVLAGDRMITNSLNNLASANSILDRLAEPAAAALSRTTQALISSKGKKLAGELPPSIDKFDETKGMIDYATQFPPGMADLIQNQIGSGLKNHLPLQFGLTMKALGAIKTLQDHLPKDPYDPTPAGVFMPTDKQKQRFMEAYHVTTNFAGAMLTPTPVKIAVAEQTNPEQLALLRDSLQGYVAQHGVAKLNPQQRRAISIILGIPLIPSLQPTYLKRLQAGAISMQGKPPAGNGPSGGVHAAQAVTMRDMPGNMKLGAGF